MRLRLTIAAALFLVVASTAVGLGDSNPDVTLYYFDPGAGVQAPESFQTKVNAFLEKVGPGFKIAAFASIDDLRAGIKKRAPDFIVLPPYLWKELGAGGKFDPILIREREHSSFYELQVVGPGKLEELKGKTLAAAGEAAPAGFLDGILLKGTGLRAQDVHVLKVGKDIDGVLAAGTGQAAAACATPGSVELVKKANPAVAGNLKVMRTVDSIPLAAVFAFGSPGEAKLAAAKRVLGDLHKSPDGKKVLKLLKSDRLVVVDAALREKLEKIGS